MKKLILLFLLFGVCNFGWSQSRYPKLETDSSGNKTIILTIEQARKLDNLANKASLYFVLNNDYKQSDSLNSKLINEKDSIILLQSAQITDYTNINNTKSLEISNLKIQNSIKEQKISNFNEIIINKNLEINLCIKDVKILKRRAILGIGIGTLSGFVLGFILH